ncbi:TetR/AcrR family transcriptional regulator [Amycolatopsis sp. NBC_01307]|uniref:TetR/AcrR family transcriptional regulator n=1 Tax=Amycolatopsis sp. NBC_01307 TaxID=2903561 RepID=UPI002E1295D2|nr:TetR/AcrR family transcriptional regulator [Amycolatopsis sp. NBC_01307]
MTSETDPRSVRSREAILNAARELLLESGPTAVTHVQVADRAGVGRATVYRHWPQAEPLLLEAMATVPMPFLDQPTTPTREWLRRELTAIARQLELDDVRAVSTTLANTALWDENMDARRAQFAAILTDRLATALDDAQTRGELTLALASRNAAALTIGPLYYRSTIEHAPTDATLIDAAIAALGDWSADR